MNIEKIIDKDTHIAVVSSDDVIMLAPGEISHSEPGEKSQFQPGKNSQRPRLAC